MAPKCSHSEPTRTLFYIFFRCHAHRKENLKVTGLHTCSPSRRVLSHPLKTCVAVRLAPGESCVLAAPPGGPHYTAGRCESDCREPPPTSVCRQHAAAAAARPALHFKERVRERASERASEAQRGLQPAAAESAAKWKIREEISRHKCPESALNP